MSDFGTLLIILGIVGMTFGAVIGIAGFIERTEANNFWECIEEGGAVDWCINNFEYDSQISIDDFYSCMEEVNRLGYCHTKFLR